MSEGDTVQLLTAREVAKMLAITPETLANWRCRRVGPEYVKVGATVRYRRDVIERWIDDGTVKTV